MNKNDISDSNVTEHIIRIYLKEFVENGSAINIINNKKWIDRKNHYISEYTKCSSTNIIEFQSGRWITLHIEDDIKEDKDKFRIAYYINPKGKDLFTKIRQLLEACGIRLKNLKWLHNPHILTSWIYSLYAAKEIVHSFSSFISETNLTEIVKKIKPFINDVSETKMQFMKVKDKINVCTDLFSISCDGYIPKVITYKYAILILHFVESLSLSDKAISNIAMKEYLAEIIGRENIFALVVIRDWFLHRTKRYIIYPKEIPMYIFIKSDTNFIFRKLRDYIRIIIHILQGIECPKIQEQPTDFIKLSKSLCDKFSKNHLRTILSDFSYEFIKQGFSIYKIDNPDKTIFNFIVNFVPLLKYIYGNQAKPYKDFTDLRNQLVHNVYILYQTNKELPYISFQSKLRELKEKLLIFNLCNRLSVVINKFKISEDSKKSRYKHIGQLEMCFKTFNGDFKDELYPKRNISTNKIGIKSELNNVIEIIEQYLKTLPLIDKSNKISIKNIKIKNFNLPTEYCRFTDMQRKLIFDHFKHLISIKNSTILTNDRIDLTSKIKDSLISIGVSNRNFNLINDSIENSKWIPNEELIKSVVYHVTTLSNMHKCSNLDLDVVLEDYNKLLDGEKFTNRKCYKKCLKSSKIKNKLYEIKLTEESFYMDLFTIVKNIIPVLFDSSSESILFRSLSQIFNDDSVLEILANECFEMENLKGHIMFLHVLVPLGTKLLCDRKLKFNKLVKGEGKEKKEENGSAKAQKDKFEEKDEECLFIRYCIKTLMMPQFKNKFFENLVYYKTKDRTFDIYQEFLEILSSVDLTSNIHKNIEYLLSYDGFQNKIMKNFKLNAQKDSQFYKSLVLSLLEFKYKSSKKCYLHKNFKDALCQIEGKTVGLSAVLKELLERKIICNSYRVTEMKFLIAQIKIKIGTENLSYKKSPKGKIDVSDLKHFTEAKNILKNLLINLQNFDNSKKKIRWELYITSYIAYAYNLLENYSKSLTKYDKLFQDLYNLRPSAIDSDLNQHPFPVYKELMKSPDYVSAVKLDPVELNILKISNKINLQRYHLGNASTNQKIRTEFFIEALKGFQKAHVIQREIVGLHNRITVSSLLKIGIITNKLNFEKHSDLYRKSAALFLIPNINKFKRNEAKCIKRFRRGLIKKIQSEKDQ